MSGEEIVAQITAVGGEIRDLKQAKADVTAKARPTRMQPEHAPYHILVLTTGCSLLS